MKSTFYILAKSFLICAFAMVNMSCTENILAEFADTDTKEARLAEINDLMNGEDFDGALLEFQAMGASVQATRENQVLLSKIYAGQCGLRFIQLSEDITDIGTSTLMNTLMGAFPGATAAEVTACINAEATILGISIDGTLRTVQENVLMAYISWSKMGVILSTYADADADGVVDGSFDPCQAADLPQLETQHMAAGLANMLDGLANIGGSSVGGSQLAGLTALCTLIDSTPGLGASFNFCTAKEVATVTANQETGIRNIILEAQDMGIGANGCAGALGSGPACICP